MDQARRRRHTRVPALKILTLLGALGADLRNHDPHVPTLPDYDLSSIPLEEALQDADLALIVTAIRASTTTWSSSARA